MARNFNGGTDRVTWNQNFDAVGTADLLAVAFRMRTTQTTANALVISKWNGVSAGGFAVIINNTANKLTLTASNTGGTQRVIFTGTGVVNNGAWRDVVVNMNTASAGANAMLLDAVANGSGNSSGTWSIASNSELLLGDSLDAFWPTYVGDIADVGYWHGTNLTADDIAAYQAGYGPRHIQPRFLQGDAPLIRDLVCRRNGVGGNVSGGTVVDHPRVYA